ncbi:protein kinase domain-containing protein [Bacillus wiedmannii]|uniref:protein kinase domain-containing protein n=1 Tax=Bacillus wiedmannii TaxID=1890302 RepID=UPI003D955103
MIPVTTRQEIYDYLSEQLCECGEAYYIEKISLNKTDDKWIDTAIVECISCRKKHNFFFDITEIFEDFFKVSPVEYLLKGWNVPKAGQEKLYPIDEAGYLKELEAYISDSADNDLCVEKLMEVAIIARDNNYPRISGRYQVIRSLKGGMGTSYLCIDTDWSFQSSRPYFVVCKTTDVSNDKDFSQAIIQGIINERDISLILGRHPNIVEVFDVIQFSPTRVLIIMEFIPPSYKAGTTLEDWINTENPIEQKIALNFAKDLCNAMIYCQSKLPGFGHGDLKPDNLFVGPKKTLKVGDFGLASSNYTSGLKLGGYIGNPLYLAPEFNGIQTADEIGDVYSFGLIVFQLLTGYHPFEHIMDRDSLRDAHRDSNINYNDIQDSQLADLLKKCLSQDRNQRPKFTDIIQILEQHTPTAKRKDSLRQEQLEVERAAQLNNQALRLISMGHALPGIQILRDLLKSFPDHFITKQNLAQGLSKSSQYEEAERVYQELMNAPEAKEKTPEAAQLFSNYAAHLIRFRKRFGANDAVKACNKALSINPNHFFALLNKGSALNTLGHSVQALPVLEKAKKIDAQNVILLYELSCAYFILFKEEKKEKFLEKSLKVLNSLITIDPSFAESYNLYKYIISSAPVKNHKNIRKFLNKLSQDSLTVKTLYRQLDNMKS